MTESLGCPRRPPPSTPASFVLAAPPHAAIHLGPDGKLGGEAWIAWPGSGGRSACARRWKLITSAPLLMLYAELAEAGTGARRETTRGRLRHAREALLFEHLWSWAPGYLTAVAGLGAPSLATWARLTLSALGREARRRATCRPSAGTAHRPGADAA